MTASARCAEPKIRQGDAAGIYRKFKFRHGCVMFGKTRSKVAKRN